jgi:LPXTG-motif cell wall-anchored protein
VSSQYWLIALGIVACAVLAGVLTLLVRRRRRSDLGAAVRTVALDTEHAVLVPNGMGGQIEIEYLLLTAHGIIVVDTKHFEGTIFGSDRMDEWTVMHKHRRFTFPNPQHTLYDRIAAVRRLVRDVPVHGHVVFSPLANFSKGRPREVMLANEFIEHYRKPDRSEVERIKEAFEPHWQQVKESLQPVETLR